MAAFAVPLPLQFRMKACVAWRRGEGFSLMGLGRLLPEAVSQQRHSRSSVGLMELPEGAQALLVFAEGLTLAHTSQAWNTDALLPSS